MKLALLRPEVVADGSDAVQLLERVFAVQQDLEAAAMTAEASSFCLCRLSARSLSFVCCIVLARQQERT